MYKRWDIQLPGDSIQSWYVLYTIFFKNFFCVENYFNVILKKNLKKKKTTKKANLAPLWKQEKKKMEQNRANMTPPAREFIF